MKLLLDTCISKSARDYLESTGNDVIWTAEWEKDPGDQLLDKTVNLSKQISSFMSYLKRSAYKGSKYS